MSTPLTDERLAEMRAELDYAGKELGEICKEGPTRRWRMRIPANADDSDLVLSAAIVAGEELLSEVERLKARLAAAEMACLAFGSMGGRMETDREKAAYELWREWAQLEPRPDLGSSGPLTDELIEKLARRRDEKRAEALAGLRKFIGGETP